MPSSVDELIRRVSSAGLVEREPRPTPIGDDDWLALLAKLHDQRALGLLVLAVTIRDIELTGEQHEQLEELAVARATTSLLLERALLETLEVLDAAGIEAVALKGQALAHTAYAAPNHRDAGDIDLLVPHDLTRAARELERAGLRRTMPELRRGFDDRFGKEITLHRPDGFEVDLHRTFVIGPAGFTASVGACLETAQTRTIGGRAVKLLAREEALLHACLVASYADDPPRLSTLRDIAQLALGGAIDVDRTLSLAREWRARAALASGVKRSWDALGLTTVRHPLFEFATSYRPTPLERVIDRSYHGAARSYTSQAAALLVLEGTRNRVSYARALLFPSAAYRSARGWRRSQHLDTLRRFVRRPRRVDA